MNFLEHLLEGNPICNCRPEGNVEEVTKGIGNPDPIPSRNRQGQLSHTLLTNQVYPDEVRLVVIPWIDVDGKPMLYVEFPELLELSFHLVSSLTS